MSARGHMRTEPAAPAAASQRQHRLVLAALIGVTALAWTYLIVMALGMQGIEGGMPPAAWDRAYFWAMLVMWVVMMAGMMLPSAAPAVLLYTALARRIDPHAVYRSTALFCAGYLVVWSGFSVLATLAQWGLSESVLLSPMMVSTSGTLTGVLFLAAAAYQLSPLKHACLAHCRSPVEFLARRRRPGALGALRLGLEHGLYCLGCCWLLMALLFAFGVMNLLWVAAIAVFVLAEKAFPAGDRIGRIGGILMAGVGTALLISA